MAERPLLGGNDSLRSYGAGYRAGDNLAALSVEARLPLTSPFSVGRFGAKGFIDVGTVWPSGSALGDQHFDRGIGGGVYFGAAAIIADADLAWAKAGRPRMHFGLGVTF